jgi:tetratricopeptide (TPR) repeat protein
MSEETLARPSAPDNVVAIAYAAGAVASLVGELAAEEMVITLHLDLRASERTVVRSATATAAVNAPDGEMPAALREVTVELLVESALDRLRPALERIAEGRTEPVDYVIDRHIAAGRARLSAGDVEAAAKEFEAALAVDPHCGPCYMALADAHIAAGRYRDAIDALQQALRFQPGDIAARTTLASCYQKADLPDQAIRQYRLVLARQPGYLFARIRLAQLYADLGRDAPAIDEYELVLAADPGNTGARLALAELALGVGRRETALAQLEGLDSIDRQDADAAVRLASRLIDEAESSQGIMLLALAFATQEEKASYEDAEYRGLAAAFDREAAAIDREGLQRAQAYQAGRADRQTLLADAEALHTRSSRLAAVAEHIAPPDELAGDHAKRTLAYRLLNQSDYELMRYAQDGAEDALTRVAMLRQSAEQTLPK